MMDDGRRDLINHLGAELAGIMEDATTDAALLRGIKPKELEDVIHALVLATDRAKALTTTMAALLKMS